MQLLRTSAPRALLLVIGASVAAPAQMPAPPTPATSSRLPIRQLAPAAATSTDSLGSIAAVRQLPNGNVLVNDQARRRVVMLDRDLKLVAVVADSTSSTANAYGVRPGGLIAYRGDSTLFVDPASLSMLLIDPNGKIVRTMAAPRPNDVNYLTGGPLGTPGFDAQGRLVYRTIDFGFRGMRPPQPGQPFTPPTPPDSSALVRFDLATRKLDTVGFYKIPKSNISMTQDDRGGMRVSVTINPLPIVDDWAVLSDGTIAFVRGRDYHVDFVDAAGKVTSAGKIPYDWQRMTDDDKQKFIDSTKAVMERARAQAAANPTPNSAQPQNGRAAADAAIGALGGGGGGGTIVTVTRSGGDNAPPRIEVGGGGAGNLPPLSFVNASELPDYKPVFGQGAVRADMDGRVWVRTIPTKVTTGGAIYEVIDRGGKLVDRVQVPANTTIAGFGAGGIVYLGAREGANIKLQKAVVK